MELIIISMADLCAFVVSMSAACVISGCFHDSECYWRHHNTFLCLPWNCTSGSFVCLLFSRTDNHDDNSDETVSQSRCGIYVSNYETETKSCATKVQDGFILQQGDCDQSQLSSPTAVSLKMCQLHQIILLPI
ncbi:hypothetical protein Y032_0009g424 [Ancylostoma ceylanicum]|uniref:Uncharacterized protein n=1 Tax=Ancylostoma ceylanicum TaxID=53326 RepID=A0A016VJH0_9BILA|nr:hypothetical protein Y032_0009g424 [Ancylostoma ceylanicum]